MSSHLYAMENVSFSYELGQQKVQALSGISLTVSPGEFLLLMGPSGSGKSTLLNLMGLIEPVQEGKIQFNEHNFCSLGEKDKNRLRRYDIGFIFQSYLLFDVLTAHENVAYFLEKQQDVTARQRKERTQQALALVGLADRSANRPRELSGGQRQRVAIARALAKHPKVIIADEPTANLDQGTSQEILTILHELTQKGTTVVMASHDPLARNYATRCLNLRDGKLAASAGETTI